MLASYDPIQKATLPELASIATLPMIYVSLYLSFVNMAL